MKELIILGMSGRAIDFLNAGSVIGSKMFVIKAEPVWHALDLAG